MNHFPEDFFPPVRLALINEKRSFCERHFTAKDYFEAFKDMAAEKSPGTDGLPYEFYKVFSEDRRNPKQRVKFLLRNRLPDYITKVRNLQTYTQKRF